MICMLNRTVPAVVNYQWQFEQPEEASTILTMAGNWSGTNVTLSDVTISEHLHTVVEASTTQSAVTGTESCPVFDVVKNLSAVEARVRVYNLSNGHSIILICIYGLFLTAC